MSAVCLHQNHNEVLHSKRFQKHKSFPWNSVYQERWRWRTILGSTAWADASNPHSQPYYPHPAEHSSYLKDSVVLMCGEQWKAHLKSGEAIFFTTAFFETINQIFPRGLQDFGSVVRKRFVFRVSRFFRRGFWDQIVPLKKQKDITKDWFCF